MHPLQSEQLYNCELQMSWHDLTGKMNASASRFYHRGLADFRADDYVGNADAASWGMYVVLDQFPFPTVESGGKNKTPSGESVDWGGTCVQNSIGIYLLYAGVNRTTSFILVPDP